MIARVESSLESVQFRLQQLQEAPYGSNPQYGGGAYPDCGDGAQPSRVAGQDHAMAGCLRRADRLGLLSGSRDQIAAFRAGGKGSRGKTDSQPERAFDARGVAAAADDVFQSQGAFGGRPPDLLSFRQRFERRRRCPAARASPAAAMRACSTTEQFRASKPRLVVRRPAQFRRDLLLWAGIYMLSFFAVALFWHGTWLPGATMRCRPHLPAFRRGLILMVSLRDPLRDAMISPSFAQGVVAASRVAGRDELRRCAARCWEN